MKFKVGDKVKIKEGHEYICETYQYYEDIASYLVVREVGEHYSYYDIYGYDNKYIISCGCFTDDDFELFEKTLNNLEVGDILINTDGAERRVLGVCGEIVFLNYLTESHSYGGGYTVHDLISYGFKIKRQKEKETILTDENGKKYKVKDLNGIEEVGNE